MIDESIYAYLLLCGTFPPKKMTEISQKNHWILHAVSDANDKNKQ